MEQSHFSPTERDVISALKTLGLSLPQAQMAVLRAKSEGCVDFDALIERARVLIPPESEAMAEFLKAVIEPVTKIDNLFRELAASALSGVLGSSRFSEGQVRLEAFKASESGSQTSYSFEAVHLGLNQLQLIEAKKMDLLAKKTVAQVTKWSE